MFSPKKLFGKLVLLGFAFLLASASALQAAAKSGAKEKVWYFAVSGDSRDCGDLIVPKIAASIEQARSQTPAEFYWHLGDLRALYREDCDILLRRDPTAKCPPDANKGTDKYPFGLYLEEAWDDFIQNQITPFGRTPYVLGIGNHELINRPRDYFVCKFGRWLDEEPIASQLRSDAKLGIPSVPGGTYYHFVKRGADFIYLDNADFDASFGDTQLAWLEKVLAADARDRKVKTIVVGMHAALPYSCGFRHAMDRSVRGVNTGLRAYDMFVRSQERDGKRVYVLASHSHFFAEDIYDTPMHKGHVLPGWIVGTAGAEQYRVRPTDRIRYGYMLVGVRDDGTISTEFKEVKREDPPRARDAADEAIADFCFNRNMQPMPDDHPPLPESDCKCQCKP
ncbi:MAG TPA: hypothetical protein VFA21_18365 [Pyrinomonadaceae bacterium]|jgi:hypothetical protein|nr:hypothetical protein [Pyrinomonadaceae bacterium]